MQFTLVQLFCIGNNTSIKERSSNTTSLMRLCSSTFWSSTACDLLFVFVFVFVAVDDDDDDDDDVRSKTTHTFNDCGFFASV